MAEAKHLKIRDLVADQAGKEVLHGISLDIEPGAVTALVGANGAGKSSLVSVIAGVLAAKSGSISLDGRRIDGQRPDFVRRAGVAVVPEGHRILSSLTVSENLIAAGSMWSKSELGREVARVLALFPELVSRLDVIGSALSGGQRQMVSISQALISRPRYLLIDELSLGLAPLIVKRIAGTLTEVAAAGVGILLIEQFTTLALERSRYAYVMERGKIVFEGLSAELRQRPDVLHDAYLAGGTRRDARIGTGARRK